MKSFASVGKAIEHFQALSGTTERATAVGVRDASEMLVHEVKEQIGLYLVGSTGPFPPTAELSDVTKDDRVRLGFTANDPGFRSGEMQESYGARVGAPGLVVRASVGSDDPRALWFEMGTERGGNVWQPARSELGIAAFRHGHRAAEIVGGLVARAVAGRALPNRSAAQEADDPLQ